jgi:hypothetical protein
LEQIKSERDLAIAAETAALQNSNAMREQLWIQQAESKSLASQRDEAIAKVKKFDAVSKSALVRGTILASCIALLIGATLVRFVGLSAMNPFAWAAIVIASIAGGSLVFIFT